MYIPEKGIYFQLVSTTTNKRIYSRDGAAPEVWTTDGEVLDDQWFTLLYGTAENGHEWRYALKTKATPKVLYSRSTAKPYVGNYWFDGAYDDNWFLFEEGFDKHEHEFRILCPSTQLVFFSRNTTDMEQFGNFRNEVFDDQYFKFVFEDMVIEKVDWDLDLGEIATKTPEVIADQKLTNNSDFEQTMDFKFSSAAEETSSFEYGVGFTIGVSTEFKTGIPFIAEGKIGLNTSVTNDWKFGRSQKFAKNYEANFGVKAGPHSSVIAKATVQSAILTVPYTITLHAKRDRSAKAYTKGVWTGLTTYNLAYEVDNVV